MCQQSLDLHRLQIVRHRLVEEGDRCNLKSNFRYFCFFVIVMLISGLVASKWSVCYQRRPQKCFQGGGGRRSIHYLLDEIKSYSCNQDFAKRFEPIPKMILFKKRNLGGMLSKLMQFKSITDGGLGAKFPVAGQFLHFLKKKHFNVIWITFRSFFYGHWK